MKMKPATVRGAIIFTIGLLVMGLTAWKTYPRQKRSLAPPANAKYMHCPECMAETSFDESKLDSVCMACGQEKGFVATTESLKTMSAKSPYGKMVAFLLPEVLVLLGALWYVLKPSEHAVGEVYRYMRCANCNQKLRYRETQVGQMGACSRCKRAFRFPEGTPRERDLDGAGADEHEYEAAED